MKDIKLFNQLPANKAEIDEFYLQAKENLLQGNENPLIIAKKLKIMENIIELLRKDDEVKDVILNEAMKYHEKTFSYDNTDFSVRETGVKYHYANCHDKVWSDLDIEIKRLTEMRKAREKMLQTGVNPETGETYKTPLKTSTTSVIINLK